MVKRKIKVLSLKVKRQLPVFRAGEIGIDRALKSEKYISSFIIVM